MTQQKKIRIREAQAKIEWPETVHPLIQRIYSSRNISSPEEIDLSLGKLLPPDKMKNIQPAAELMCEAIKNQKKILIVGDFDADGATSTALSVRALGAMGAAHVTHLVPNRFDYGYGLTPGIVKEAIKRRPDLIMTVDNGISSIEGVALARENGIDVLVTDHHLPGDRLPDANVILNPNQVGDEFPGKSLAGVGVVFYLLIVIRQQLRQSNWFAEQQVPEPNLADYLDIVALGTVADVVPLDRNNRILVNEGVRRIRAGQCAPGISALLEVAGRKQGMLIASDLGFAVGPRLNAAGRLDDMSVGIECLLADESRARSIAFELDRLNRERRQIEDSMKQEALGELTRIESLEKAVFGLALFDESWHQGVIGILASRLKEKIHRPVVIFAPGDNDEIKGSARSIPGIHIRDVLERLSSLNPGMIKKFGGHAMAAGLTIEKKNFNAFETALNETVRSVATDDMLENTIFSDGELSVDDFCLETVHLLNDAGPWGQAFPEPVFSGTFRVIQQRILKDKHFKLVLSPVENDAVILDGIAFNQLDTDSLETDVSLPDEVELVFKLSINEFRGQQNLQLMIDTILS